MRDVRRIGGGRGLRGGAAKRVDGVFPLFPDYDDKIGLRSYVQLMKTQTHTPLGRISASGLE